MKRLLLCAALLGPLPFAHAQDAPPAAPATQSPAPPEKPAKSDTRLARKIAKAYGVSKWDDVEELHFTFNVKRPGSDEVLSRKWTWWPKQNTVKLHSSDGHDIMYPREIFEHGEPVQLTIDTDKQFINDHYWLLFPFQLVWSNPTVTDHGKQPLPIGEGTGRKVTTQYPSEGGYTPGDAYDLYLDRDHRITQWVYRKGGGADGRAMTWENHAKLGPITVSTEHWSEDRQFHLWFTDVSAKLSNGKVVTIQQPAAKESR